jgi:ornithine cyclodeaminase
VPPAYHDQEEVRARLDYPGCIAAVRAAMSALSQDERPQPLRTIVDMGEGRLFAQMPGMLSGSGDFGAKLISVFPAADRPGRPAHRGVVVLFDGESGVVRCVADAGEITHIRTGCASAVATDVLARPDARRLAIFGCGAQAESHIEALAQVRDFEAVGVWGRDPESARGFAERMARRTGLEIASVDDPRRLRRHSRRRRDRGGACLTAGHQPEAREGVGAGPSSARTLRRASSRSPAAYARSRSSR